MNDAKRLLILKIGAFGLIGLVILNWLVISPIVNAWGAQSDRIDALRQKVQRGQQLVDREDSIRNKWKSMLQANLPEDLSLASSETYQSIERWALNGGINVQSLIPNWDESHLDDGYATMEYRVQATGNLASIGRFMYDLETDPTPVDLQECELQTRDERGQELTMTARISFLRIVVPKEASR